MMFITKYLKLFLNKVFLVMVMGKYTIQSRYQKFRRIIKKHWGEILIFSENSWRYAFSHVRNHPRPSEPTYVGAYLRYGLEYLNNVLPNSKPGNKLDKEGFQLKFGGIFVHQSPIVELIPITLVSVGYPKRDAK